MGRLPPTPPKRPDGRYAYVAESDPPEGFHRRGVDENTDSDPVPSPPYRSTSSDPPAKKVTKALTAKAVGKVVEWAVGAACVSGLAWLTTRASNQDIKDVRAEVAAESSARATAIKLLSDRLDVEERTRVDAGTSFGESLNRQDAINRHVWEITRKKRDETAPPAVGPKAQAEGRQ